MKLRSSVAKGQKLVRYAVAILESQGARVEVATNKIVWIFDKAKGLRGPISVKHDYFGCWDLIALHKDGVRAFYQVTTADNVSKRRDKILAAGMLVNAVDLNTLPPYEGMYYTHWTEHDAILSWTGGRGRHFKVWRGPLFDTWNEKWPVTPSPSQSPSARAGSSRGRKPALPKTA